VTSRRFRLLFDMDGVLADLGTPWLARYNADHGDSLTPEHLTSWGIHQHVKIGMRMYDYLAEPGWFLQLAPMPGAAVALDALATDGHELFVVTASPHNAPTGLYDKARWLRTHLPMIPAEHVIVAHRKDMVAGDILLDDSPEHLGRFPGVRVVYDHPYNRSFAAHHHRIASLAEYVTLIRGLARGGGAGGEDGDG
jgi:5'-nucleotidase